MQKLVFCDSDNHLLLEDEPVWQVWYRDIDEFPDEIRE